MLPKWHVLYGFGLSILLIDFFSFSLFAAFVVFLSAVFIDLDHVLLYFIETRNLSPKKFWDWDRIRKESFEKLSINERCKIRMPHLILHGVEFIIILLALSFISKFFVWVLIGVILHLVLDMIDLLYGRVHHCSLKISQIWLWQRNKNKKKLVIE